MRVILLGPVSASVGDRTVDLGPPRQRAVFALLAMRPGRIVPMDWLIDELWHEDPPAQATVTLRAYISRLRRSLEAVSDADGVHVEIRTRPPGWVLDIAPDDVDLVNFQERITGVHALLGSHQEPRAADLRSVRDQLLAALGLWRGQAFADLQSVGVAREAATHAEEARAAAVELLLETRVQLGEDERVVEDARPFLDAHPYRERAWAALALSLYRSGRQSDAVASIAELRRLLLDDLGLDPSPLIQELELQVLRQDPNLRPVRQPMAAMPMVEEVPGTGRHHAMPSDEPLVVGYAEILHLLDESVAASRRGRGHLLVLQSEAGGGKTTMLQVLARKVEAEGGRVVHGGGGGAGAMPALWSWVTVVRQLSVDDARSAVPGMAPASAAMITARALMMAPPAGSAAAPVEVSLSRTGLYRGVIELLAAAHQQAPLTVVLDDIQWVDDETLTLLSLAVNELSPQGVLFAVGLRTDEPDTRRVQTALLRTPHDQLVRHHLNGLDKRAVADLVFRATGEPVDEQVVEALHTTTGGNALFVTELVSLLAAERRLDLQRIATTLPERVHDVLQHRIERLPAASIAAMQIVALARSPVDLELLAAVTGQELDQVLDDAEAALIAGLLVEHRDGAGFTPSHDLVRQALLLDLSDTRRVRLHARLAAALQAQGQLGPEKVLEVAHHLIEAAPAVGPAAAIPYLLTASEDAISRYATRTAAKLLEEALVLAARIDEPEARAETERLVRGRLALVQTYLGADAALPENPPLPPPPVDDASLGSWVGIVTTTAAAGDLVWARDAARTAISTPLTPSGQVAARLAAGWTSMALGETDAAERFLRRVLELVDEGAAEGATGLLGPAREAASGWLALILHERGEDTAASSLMDRARQAPVSEIGLVNLDLHECLLAAMRADPSATRARASEMAELAERLEYSVFALYARIFDAWATAVLDDHPEATGMESALVAHRSSGLVLFEPTFDVLLAEVYHLAGNHAAGRSAVERARLLSRRTGEVIHGHRLNALAAQLGPTRS